MLRHIAICLFSFARVVCSQMSTSKESSVYFAHEFKEPVGHKTVDVSGVRQAFIRATGYGLLQVAIESITHKTQTEVFCPVFGKEVVCMLWSRQEVNYDPLELYKLVITGSIFESGKKKSIKFELVGGLRMEVISSQKVNIKPGWAKSIDLLVKIDSDPKIPDQNKHRLSFLGLQDQRDRIDLPQSMFMFVKQGSEKVHRGNADFNATSKMGIGMIVVILPTDEAFCLKQGCTYSVRIEANDVPYLEFSTQVLGPVTDLDFGEDTSFIERLRENDQVVLRVEDKAKRANDDWAFHLVPVEGNPDFAVSFDKPALAWADNLYHSDRDSSESIFVSKAVLRAKGLVGEVAYITVKSLEPAMFILEVSAVPNTLLFLEPNMPVTGEVQAGKSVTYLYSASASLPALFTVFLKLSSLENDPNLFVKNCSSENYKTCFLSNSEKTNKVADLPDSLFKYSLHPEGDDSLQLKYNCIPSSEDFADFRVEEKNSKYFTTRDCTFGVTVFGLDNGKSSRYSLELRGSRSHQVVSLGRTTYLNLVPKTPAYFSVELNSTEANDGKFVIFKFLVVSGQADIYLSRSHPFPDEENHDKQLVVDEPTSTASLQHKYASFRPSGSSLKSRFYVTVVPKKFFYGNLLVYASQTDMEDPLVAKFLPLSLGEPTLATLPSDVEGVSQSFYFDLDEVDAETEVAVDLRPFAGKFDLCVSPNADALQTPADCTWRDENLDGKVLISSSDKNFKRKARYGVLVSPKPASVFEGTNFTFTLTVSTPDTLLSLDIGSTLLLSQLVGVRYFKVEISKQFTNFVIMTDSEDDLASLAASTNRLDLYLDKPSKKLKTAQGKNSAILFTKEDIERFCVDHMVGLSDPVHYLHKARAV